MQERTEVLMVLRPKIETVDKALDTNEVEAFQNDVLRPILKFQNILLLHLFVDYAYQYKGVFFKLNKTEQLDYINKSIRTNQLFRNKLIGTVVALFSLEELQFYSLNTSSHNKRIVSMLIIRLQDQQDLLNDGLAIEVSR